MTSGNGTRFGAGVTVARSTLAAVLLLFPAASALPPASAAAGQMSATPTLSVSPSEGPPDTPFTVSGDGFGASVAVDLEWQTVVGDDATTWQVATSPLAAATADASGRFSLPLTVPWDLGGPPHRIEAKVGGSAVANTTFTITRKAWITPVSGPEGTEITIRMIGGGWTWYDNIANIMWDNWVVGYGCTFGSQGNLTVFLKTFGGPGKHKVQIVPSIYRGPDAGVGPQPWSRPMYGTYDLPTPYPIFSFDFEITGDSPNPPVFNKAEEIQEVAITLTPVIPETPAVAVDNGTPQVGFGNGGKGLVGGKLPVAIAGFAAGAKVDLKWDTVSAKPKIDLTNPWTAHEFLGWPTTPKVIDAGQLVAGADGKAKADLQVPSDFAGSHKVRAEVEGRTLATSSFLIIPRADARLSADGSAIEVTTRGQGILRYNGAILAMVIDGRQSGVITGITTGGEGHATLPVVGTAGRHSIEFRSASQSVPFLNPQETPFPWMPAYRYEYTIEDPNAGKGASPAAATDVSLVVVALAVGLLAGLVAGRVSARPGAARDAKPAPKAGKPAEGGAATEEGKVAGIPEAETK